MGFILTWPKFRREALLALKDGAGEASRSPLGNVLMPNVNVEARGCCQAAKRWLGLGRAQSVEQGPAALPEQSLKSSDKAEQRSSK